MTTPHVAGIAVLVKAVNPENTVAQVKQAIMNGVDVKSSLSGKCVTGGRVIAGNILIRKFSYFFIGDWNGDGSTGIGIYRTNTGYWYLDNNNDGAIDTSVYLI